MAELLLLFSLDHRPRLAGVASRGRLVSIAKVEDIMQRQQFKPPFAVPFTLLAVLAAAPPAAAQFLSFDDFEDEGIGSVGGQDGWITGNAEIVVVADPADPFNQVLLVPSDSSVLRKALSAELLVVPDRTQRMMFMRMRVGQKQTFSVGLSSMSAPDEYSDFATEMGLANSANNLDLRVWDEDIGHYQDLIELEPDVWYNIWTFIDTEANTFELWLHDSPGQDAGLFDQLSAPDGHDVFTFRTGWNSDLVSFYLKSSGGSSDPNDGPVYFDDIYIETTATLNLSNPAVDACPPDMNNDGQLDFFDVLNFLGQFAAGDEQAEFTGDGVLDFFDVQAFLDAFAGGCG